MGSLESAGGTKNIPWPRTPDLLALQASLFPWTPRWCRQIGMYGKMAYTCYETTN